jgi:hypothetical protein
MQKVHDAVRLRVSIIVSSIVRRQMNARIHQKTRSGRIDDVGETVRVDQSVSGSFRVFIWGRSFQHKRGKWVENGKLFQLVAHQSADVCRVFV